MFALRAFSTLFSNIVVNKIHLRALASNVQGYGGANRNYDDGAGRAYRDRMPMQNSQKKNNYNIRQESIKRDNNRYGEKKNYNKSWNVANKMNNRFPPASGGGGGRRSQPSPYYANQQRYEKRFMLKGRAEMYAGDELDNQDPRELFESEEILDLYSKDENLYHNKIVDEDIKRRYRTKIAIIKKRMAKLYGQDEKMFNLLTWDAKEQIKYLNLNEPHIWTPERIAECFPISVQSAKKLLTSKWAPKTLDDLADHDQRVIYNWSQLAKMNNGKELEPGK
jgi:hypothetical protein